MVAQTKLILYVSYHFINNMVKTLMVDPFILYNYTYHPLPTQSNTIINVNFIIVNTNSI